MDTVTLRGNDALAGQGLTFEGRSVRADFRFADFPVPLVFASPSTFVWTIGTRSVLTAVSTIADEDGVGRLGYQWRADGQAIAGATGATLTLGQAEAGRTIAVVASYVDGFGQAESLASDADPNAVHVNTFGIARLSGTLGAGQTLHVDVVDQDHAGKIYYQWQVADGSGAYRDAEGAWSSDFTLGASVPAAVRVLMTHADRYGVVEALANSVGTDGVDRMTASAEHETLMAQGGDDIIGHLGRGHRIDIGTSLLDIAEAFVASGEFRQLYGETPTHAEIVTKFYQNVLGRAPDPQSRFWVDLLDSGRATVAEVLVGFSESAENVAALVGVRDSGIDFTPYGGS